MARPLHSSMPNPEEVATHIMQAVLKGDHSTLHSFLNNSLEPDKLQYVLSQLRLVGNKAFKQENYAEAIDYYNQALAGTRQKKDRAILFSNLSAAYLRNNQFTEALQAAREAIKEKPDWSKGWCRAAQIFEAQKSYGAAATVLKAAAKRDPESKHIQAWQARLVPLISKEKALERLSIDYSRFEDIVVSDDKDEADCPGTSSSSVNCATSNTIEFSENLSTEARKQLENILTKGGFEGSEALHSAADDEVIRPHLTFNLKTRKNNATATSIKMSKSASTPTVAADQIRKGLLNLLHVRSELLWTRRVAFTQLLYAPSLLNVYLTNIYNIGRLTPREAAPDRLQTIWLFMGIGTAVPLIAATQLDPERHAITACTNHTYPFSLWMSERMLDINGQLNRPNLRVVNNKVKKLTIISNSTDLLDAEIVDMPHGKASVVVIDQDCFDATGIGKGAISDIRELRSRYCVTNTEDRMAITPSLRTVPAAMRIILYGATISPTVNTFSSLGPHWSNAEKMANCVEQGRWNVNWETLPSTPYHELGSAESGVVLLTEPVVLYMFTFGGELAQLDADLSLESPPRDATLNVVVSGVLNCLLIRTEFQFYDDPINVNEDNQTDLFLKKTWQYGAAGPAVCWVLPKPVVTNSRIPIETQVANGCQLSVRLTNWDDAHHLRSWSIPRWQYDTFLDTDVLQDLNGVIQDKVKQIMLQKIKRLDARPYLLHSSRQHIEILLLNSCLGLSAVTALRAAAEVYALRGSRPNPQIHVTAVESSQAHAAIAKRMAHCCVMDVSEDALTAQRLRDHPNAVWIPFSDPADDKKSTDQKEYATQSDETALLAKSKLKSRLTVVAKDPRLLRPPENMMDAKCRLASTRLLNRPISEIHSKTADEANLPYYNLPDKADLVVSQMIDCGLLGEGLLPIIGYAHEALTKPKRMMIPAMARIYAAGVALGPRAFPLMPNGIQDTPFTPIRPSCWYKHLVGDARHVFEFSQESEYISLCFDDIEHRWMTPPVLAFTFDFEHLPEASDPLRPVTQWETTVDVQLNALEDGVVHAVAFWYEILFETERDSCERSTDDTVHQQRKPRGYSTRPSSITTTETTSLRSCRRAKQACCLMPDALAFKKDEVISLSLWHTRSSIGVRWNRDVIKDYTLRHRRMFCTSDISHPIALAWRDCAENHEQRVEQLGTLLNNSDTGHPNMLQTVADQLGSIAISPHKVADDIYIEPEEAYSFFLNLYS